MIRTLRRKFILVNMLLVSLVLLMVFGVFMASSAQRLKDQSLLAMRAALMWGEEGMGSTETQMFMGKSGAGTIFCRQIQTLKVYMAHCMRLSDAATSCLTMWRK